MSTRDADTVGACLDDEIYRPQPALSRADHGKWIVSGFSGNGWRPSLGPGIVFEDKEQAECWANYNAQKVRLLRDQRSGVAFDSVLAELDAANLPMLSHLYQTCRFSGDWRRRAILGRIRELLSDNADPGTAVRQTTAVTRGLDPNNRAEERGNQQ